MDSDDELVNPSETLAPWDARQKDDAATPSKSGKRKHNGEDGAEDETPAKTQKKSTKAAAVVSSSKKKSGKCVCFCPGCLVWFQPKDIAPGQRLFVFTYLI